MRQIRCRYYEHSNTMRWDGYLEPLSGRWIAFLGRDGKLVVFYRRDPETGAVPLELPSG